MTYIGNLPLNRFCAFCKARIMPWLRVPEWCCDEYHQAVKNAVNESLGR